MKHLFIVNPAAGKGKTLKYIPIIESIFKKRNEEYCIEVTQRPGHAVEIVRQYASRDTYRVYSIGGDGTLNEVLNGIAGTGSSLAIIPGGSGNDFIRSLNGIDIEKDIIEKTIDGSETLIDIAKVNGKYFINISSIGFDAEVVYNTIKLKKLPFITGSLAYMASVIMTLIGYKSKTLEISLDGKNTTTKALLVAVANGRFYGGGMMAAPDARLDDGLFDVCLVKKIGRLKILKFFPQFIKGKHGKIPEVSFIKSKTVEIASNSLMPLNIDGEIERVQKAVFEIIPKGVKVVVPR